MCLFIVLLVLFLIAAFFFMLMASTFLWAVIFAVISGLLVFSMIDWAFRWHRQAAMVDHPSPKTALKFTIIVILILIGLVKWYDHHHNRHFDTAQIQTVQVNQVYEN